MKAILVIDMPKNCAECKLMYLQGIGEGICNAVDWEERPKWCPLKPMPQKDYRATDPFYRRSLRARCRMAQGWNKCIEEIENGN